MKNFPSLFTPTKAGNLGCLPSNPVEKLARQHSWIKADVMVEGLAQLKILKKKLKKKMILKNSRKSKLVMDS